MSLVDLIDQLSHIPHVLLLLFVGIGQGLEYIFPPAPADTATLAATVVATRSGASWIWIALYSTGGGVIGSIAAWYIGRWVVHSGRVERLEPSKKRSIERVLAAFERHGAIWLCTNRFFPGIRGFFFIAAAMAGIPLRVSVFWAAISAALWSALIVGIGAALADNLEVLVRAMHNVRIASVVLVIVLLAVLVRYLFRMRKTAMRASEAQDRKDKSARDAQSDVAGDAPPSHTDE